MLKHIEKWIEAFDPGTTQHRFFELVQEGYKKEIKSNYGHKKSIKFYIDDYKGIPVDPKSLFTLLYHPLHPVRNIIELKRDEFD